MEAIIYKHPLKNKWCLMDKDMPSMGIFVGTKKECEKLKEEMMKRK